MSLKEKYVKIHKQGWIPIIVRDGLDPLKLAEICVQAGFGVIEITCMRADAVEKVRQIRLKYPELTILVGSTVDNDKIVKFLKKSNPGMPALEELANSGVDGFVSRLPFMEGTIKKFRDDFILLPGAETLKEAYEMLDYGAHFVKFCVDVERVKQINSEPTHKLFPIFVTGDATAERIPAYIKAGVRLLGGGFDMMLKDLHLKRQSPPRPEIIHERLMEYKKIFRDACASGDKGYLDALKLGTDEYINTLGQYHPF